MTVDGLDCKDIILYRHLLKKANKEQLGPMAKALYIECKLRNAQEIRNELCACCRKSHAIEKLHYRVQNNERLLLCERCIVEFDRIDEFLGKRHE